MTTTVAIILEPIRGVIQGAKVGNKMSFTLRVRTEVTPVTVPKTYVPFNFAGYTLLGYIKSSVNSALVLATLTIVTPGVLGAGYMDVSLTAAQTTTLGKGDFVGSIKMWPVGNPDAAITLMTLCMDLTLVATP